MTFHKLMGEVHMGGKWKRLPAAVLSFILISVISVNAYAEDQPKYYYASQADILDSSQFMFTIGEIVNPGDSLPDVSKGSEYFFISDTSLSVPDGFDFCFADAMVQDEAKYEEALAFMEKDAVLVDCKSSEQVVPAALDNFYAWQIVIIAKETGNGKVKVYAVPYNPTNEFTINYDEKMFLPLLSSIGEAVEIGNSTTVEWNEGDGLPSVIVKELVANPDINVHFQYSYQGVAYDLYLNGNNLSKVYKEGIEWYGPLCLAACNGMYTGTNGWYVVKGDDSENAFAQDLIYPGQKIHY